MNMSGPWSALSVLGSLMALGGSYYVLYSAVTLLKNRNTNLKQRLRGIFRFSKTGTDSTSRSMGRGIARATPSLLIAGYFLALMLIPVSLVLAKYYTRFPTYEIGDEDHLVEVLNYDRVSGKWEFRYKAIDFWMKLCEVPPFVPGDFLKLYKYEDRGPCVSLAGEWTAVLIKRDEHGRTDSEVRDERKR